MFFCGWFARESQGGKSPGLRRAPTKRPRFAIPPPETGCLPGRSAMNGVFPWSSRPGHEARSAAPANDGKWITLINVTQRNWLIAHPADRRRARKNAHGRCRAGSLRHPRHLAMRHSVAPQGRAGWRREALAGALCRVAWRTASTGQAADAIRRLLPIRRPPLPPQAGGTSA